MCGIVARIRSDLGDASASDGERFRAESVLVPGEVLHSDERGLRADEVIDESAIEFEGEEISDEALEKEVTKFRSFLENVTPDEFAAGDEPD